MPTLAEQAREAHRGELALLEAAAEHGELVDAIAGALLAGRALALLAEPPHAPIAREIAHAIRRPFGHDLWPPLLTLTPDPRLLSLIGCDYGLAEPLAHQAELLLLARDVALVVAGPQPSDDLRRALGIAATRGAVVAALGLPPCDIQAQPRVSLPQAPDDQLLACQLALGHALAHTLAERLPRDHPHGLDTPLAAFHCDNCHTPHIVPAHLAGRRGVCPACYNNILLAPDLASPDAEQRSSLRFGLRQCSLALALAAPNKPPVPVPGQMTLANLSRGGLLCDVANPGVELQPGDPIHIKLHTPAFQQPLLLPGTVLRITREQGRHRIGIVFGDCPPATTERLRILERNLVLRHLTARPA